MLKPEDIHQRDLERQAFKLWWAGERAATFVLERRPAYCVCEVLFPSWWSQLRVAWRGTAAWLASKVPGSPLKVFLYRRLGVKIGRRVYIAPDVVLDPLYPELIELSDDAFLGYGCRIFTHEYTATQFRLGRVRVGPGSVIGGYAVVRCGVNIGAKATVGMMSYVNRDVLDGETAVGVPARVLPEKEQG